MTIDLDNVVPSEWETPSGWRVVAKAEDGVFWRVPGGLHAMVSTAVEDDGRLWIHMSMSHKSRMPTWPELVKMRDALVGTDVECYQVLPPADRYVNLNPHVLHLWACAQSPEGVLPKFEGMIGGVKTI